MWECPQLFSIDGREALLTSVFDEGRLCHVIYGLGELTEDRFETQTWGRLTYGDSYYAPTFFRDQEGAPCVMYWMRGVRDDTPAAHTGAISVPHALALEGDLLVGRFHPQVREQAASIAADAELPVTGAYLVDWVPQQGRPLSVRLDGAEICSATLTSAGLTVQTGQSGTTTVPWAGGEVEILLDRSCLEITSRGGSLGAAVEVSSGSRSWRIDGGGRILQIAG